MPNATEAQIKARISEFVEELDKIVRLSTLEALQGALANRSAPARRGRPAGSRRGPGRPKGSGRGGNVDDVAAKIVAHVKANDGLGIGAIAAATRVDLPLAKKAAIQLLASGALKKSGVRRGTVYHIGGGKPARAKAARRRIPKAKRVIRKAKKATKPVRKAPRRKQRATKTLTPAPKRAAPKSVAASAQRTTDVPAALAVG